MKRLLPDLDVDLLIEHGGHTVRLRGSRMHFVAQFPDLLSAFHFLRIFWPARTAAPREAGVRIQWRNFSLPVKLGLPHCTGEK